MLLFKIEPKLYIVLARYMIGNSESQLLAPDFNIGLACIDINGVDVFRDVQNAASKTEYNLQRFGVTPHIADIKPDFVLSQKVFNRDIDALQLKILVLTGFILQHKMAVD